MSSKEKFCLKWNDFQENIGQTFKLLRTDLDFSDVTLVSEDGQQVEANKFILAASSPFFLNLLKKNKHPHPLIYMRGITFEDLLAIVDFVYHGETNIYQENLDSFLAIAEELNLKGLARGNQGIETEETPKQNQNKKKILKKDDKKEVYQHVDETYDQHVSSNQETTVAVMNPLNSVDVQELDEKIKSMMKIGDKITAGSQVGSRARICNICGKEGTLTNIKDHIESNHIEGITHPCSMCYKTFRSRHSLSMHKSSVHKH